MSKYKAKIEKVFAHPVSGNIDPKKLLHALEHFGAEVELTKQNKAKVFYNGVEYVMPLSHGGNLSKDVVMEVKHFLEKAGLTPEKL